MEPNPKPDPTSVRPLLSKPAGADEFQFILNQAERDQQTRSSLIHTRVGGRATRWNWHRFILAGFILATVSSASVWAGETEDLKAEVQRLQDESQANKAELQELRSQIQLLRQLVKNQNQTGSTNSSTISNETLQENLAGVRSDVQTLRDQLNRSIDSTISPNNNKIPTSTRPVQLYSTIQVQGLVSDNDLKATTANSVSGGKVVQGTNSTAQGFKINNFIVGFQGTLFRDYADANNVYYNLSVDAVSPNQNNFNIQPYDVYLGYNILPTINAEKPQLNIQIGQQIKQFGVEAVQGDAYVTTINRAGFVSSLGLLTRDVGALVNGTLFVHDDFGDNYTVPLIQYYAGVFNGAGANTLNYSGQVAPNARLVLNAPVDYNSWWRGLSVGGSYYGGYVTNLITSTKQSLIQDASRYGADISWIHSPFGITAEYVYANDGIGGGSTPALRGINESGFAVTAFYQWGEKYEKDFSNQDRHDDWFPQTYQPFVRIEEYNDDKHDPVTGIVDNNVQTIYTLGFNWFFAATTKLQFNYRYIDNSRTAPHAENQFITQFQYGF